MENSGRRSHHWPPRSGGFLYGWLVASRQQFTEDWLSGIPLKILRFPPRSWLMIGCAYYSVNHLSYQCPQCRLADSAACWQALQHAAIHKPPWGTCPCLSVWDCIPSITFPVVRCAAKPASSLQHLIILSQAGKDLTEQRGYRSYIRRTILRNSSLVDVRRISPRYSSLYHKT